MAGTMTQSNESPCNVGISGVVLRPKAGWSFTTWPKRIAGTVSRREHQLRSASTPLNSSHAAGGMP